MYILRNGNFLDIKNLFANSNYFIGRGRGQKLHLISPLEFRLNCYLLAMYNFDFKLINELNMFYRITKDRYLLSKAA